jgi:hypothetical protein
MITKRKKRSMAGCLSAIPAAQYADKNSYIYELRDIDLPKNHKK